MNPTLDRIETDDKVREIFHCIFNGPMEQFVKPLEVIRENQYGLVWREESERNDKVMIHARTLLSGITTNLHSNYAEASKHIEGSTCDLFLQYVYKKLDDSLLGQDPFKDSCKEIKQWIKKKIVHIQWLLETKQDEQPEQKSNLEVMISETDLFDPIHIRHSLLCCQVAYDCNDPEYSKHSLENLEKEHLLSELSVSYENEHVPKYVMARCGDVLYVSFKGVQSHNLGSTEKSHRGEICTGVSDAAKKIPLKYFARKIYQNKRLVFSGHSNGGAVAALVFVFLLEKLKDLGEEFLKSHFKCITFGLMPLGDSKLKGYVEAIPGARECFRHIVLENDIVPKLFGSFNMANIQNKLWKLVEPLLKPTFSLSLGDRVTQENKLLKYIAELCKEHSHTVRHVVGFHHLDIFGMYCIVDASKQGQKYSVETPEQATKHLTMKHSENLREILSQYLIYHKLERYAHEVELAFRQEFPGIENFITAHNMTIVDDITPKITEVRFESIGEKVIAKISGNGMWFVYHVSIEGVGCDGKNLTVDVTKSSDSEVQTTMRKPHLYFKGELYVRVKTHFHNSKCLKQIKVPADTTTYRVTRRQQQLAKHSPGEVMELAYLSALLEHHKPSNESKRFKDIKIFLESAVSVVPLESIFHTMANAELDVMLPCCELLSSSGTLPAITLSSEKALASMKSALSRIEKVRDDPHLDYYISGDDCDDDSYHDSDDSSDDDSDDDSDDSDDFDSDDVDGDHHFAHKLFRKSQSKLKKYYQLMNYTYSIILELETKCKSLVQDGRNSPCNIDLEVIYPSSDDVKNTRTRKAKRCKAPMTLLEEGREELNRLSEELIDEHSQYESTSSNTNAQMLKVLNKWRKKFKTCRTLLGTFMESQVQIPLENAAGDKYVYKLAEHAKSFGLSVWGLLILPFKVLNQLVGGNVSEGFRQFVIEFSRQVHGIYNRMFPPPRHHFPHYDERLEFLVGSMKESWTCNQKYVSYSLERQLEDQCKRRNIYHNTSVEEILDQWNDNFANETLTLVPNEYRRLVARWIKWSLMINNLRESLASQTAVGVIGLVNSGKSKFVRSLFGKETITGTTDQKRTTVPLIYNVGQNIKGMDVIDFPGVDDRDKSIPELAELLLSLTRIIIFVVDYRRAHTESTKQWLKILDKENVPVLICLTFADKLFAELMGENGHCDIEKVKRGVEEQLTTIKEQIGQPKSGHQRDFKLTVFSFDNDSNLNTDEGKEKLRKVGLKDELDVGRWIAEKLQEYEPEMTSPEMTSPEMTSPKMNRNDVSQNVFKFIEAKKESTLDSNRRALVPVSPVKEKIGEGPVAKKKRVEAERRPSGEEQPTCSTWLQSTDI